MGLIRTLYFPIFLGIALLIYTAQHFEWVVPELANNYMNDLLCMPIVLKTCQYAGRYLKSDQTLEIPILLTVVLTVLFAFYFERILPRNNVRYTADIWDVLAYFMGLLLFLFFEGQVKLKKANYV